MSELSRRLIPADLREDALRIEALAKNLVEFLDLYEDVYADDLHEEIVNGFEFIVASAKGAASRQQAMHEWSSALADSVNADLERLMVAEPPAEGDVLSPSPFDDVEVPGSLLSETEALADRRDPKHYPFPVDIDPDEEKPW